MHKVQFFILFLIFKNRSEIGQTILNCVSPLRDFSVKLERFQIKSSVLNLKSALNCQNGEGVKTIVSMSIVHGPSAYRSSCGAEIYGLTVGL